jgi:WD40 repeat protein
MTLIFDGRKMLEDDMMLGDYEVHEGAQLLLMVNTNLKKAPQSWKIKKSKSTKKPAHFPPPPLPVNDKVYLVSGGAHRLIYLRDVEDMKVLRIFDGHNHEITNILCSDCGQKIVSASKHEIIVWSIPSGQKERQIEGHRTPVNSIACTGQVILEGAGETTTTEGELKMFSLSTGEELISIQGAV